MIVQWLVSLPLILNVSTSNPGIGVRISMSAHALQGKDDTLEKIPSVRSGCILKAPVQGETSPCRLGGAS